MTVFLGCSYFCEYRRVKYSNLGYHNCKNLYSSCYRYDYNCVIEKSITCKSCKVISRNIICKKLHDSGQCYKLRLCDKCGNLKSKTGPHACGEEGKWCSNCKISVNYEHRCYIKKCNEKKNRKKVFRICVV
jgi:hypothetical protein